MARLKLAGFREHWRAEHLHRDEQRWLMEVRAPASLWQRCLGRVRGLLLEVVLGHPRPSAGQVVPVRISLQPLDCGRGKGAQVLADLAPAVLSSLHTYLSTQSTRQGQERYPLAQPVHVQSRAAGLAVSARLRDVGREELALLSPCPLPSGAVTLTLSRWASPNVVQVPGWVRDCVPGSDGQFEVEVCLGG
jgi:hypothetical protein